MEEDLKPFLITIDDRTKELLRQEAETRRDSMRYTALCYIREGLEHKGAPHKAAGGTTPPKTTGQSTPKSPSTTNVLSAAAKMIKAYADENYPEGEFRQGLLRASFLIRPIGDPDEPGEQS